jgi:hypothetical protein
MLCGVDVSGMDELEEAAKCGFDRPYYRTSSEIVDDGFTAGSFSKEDFAGSCGSSVWIGASVRFSLKIKSNQNFSSDQILVSALASFAGISAHPEHFADGWCGMSLTGGKASCECLLERLSAADLSNVFIKEISNHLEAARLWFHRALLIYDQRMEEEMEEEDALANQDNIPEPVLYRSGIHGCL